MTCSHEHMPVESPVPSKIERAAFRRVAVSRSSPGVHLPQRTISESMTQHVAEADTQLKLFLMNSVFLSGVCVPIVGPPMQGKQGIECLFAPPRDALLSRGNP